MIVKIIEALTDEELREAKLLHKQHKYGQDFQEQARTSIIRPNLARINKKLGTTNNEHYLAIALQEALHELGAKEDKRPARNRNDSRK